MAEANWREIQRLNWLFFRPDDDFDDSFAKLIETVQQDPEHMRMHTRLLIRARDWDASERSSGLLTGIDIADAETWLVESADKDPAPTRLHLEYIGASRAAANRRQQGVVVATFAALIVTIALAIMAGIFGLEAREQSEIAQENERIALTNQQLAVFNEQTAVANQELAEANAATARAEEQRANNNAAEAATQAAIAIAEEQRANDNAATAIAEGERANANAAEAATQAAIANDNAATAVAEQQRADTQAQLALSRQLAAQSRALVDENLAVALLLAVEGQRVADTYEAQDSLLRVLETQSVIERYLNRYSGEIGDFAVSPDGNLLAAAGDDGQIWLTDARTGRGIGLPLNQTHLVTALHFLDDTRLMAASADETLNIWDTESGTLVEAVRSPRLLDNPLQALAFREISADFTADGSRLVVATLSNAVTLYDTATGEALTQILPPSTVGLFDDPDTLIDIEVRIHPEARYLVVIRGRRITLYNIEGDTPEMVLDRDERLSPTGAFSPDGRLFAWYDREPGVEGSLQASVRVLDLTTLETREPLPLADTLSEFVTRMAFSSDSETVFVGTIQCDVLGLNVNDGTLTLPVTRAFTLGVRAFAAHPDGELLYAGSSDGRAAILRQRLGSTLVDRLTEQPFVPAPFRLEAHPDTPIMVGRAYDEVYLLDSTSGDLLLPPFLPYEDVQDTIFDVTLHPSESLLATFSDEGDLLRLWDYSSGGYELVMEGQHPEANFVVFSPDGRWLITHGFSPEIHVWDAAGGGLVSQTIVSEERDIFGAERVAFQLAFNRAEDYFVTTGTAITPIDVWRIEDDGTLSRLPDLDLELPEAYEATIAFSSAFSADGQSLAFGDLDGLVHLWDLQDRRQVIEPIQLDGDIVVNLSFQPDGRTLAALTLRRVHLLDRFTGRPFGEPLEVGPERIITAMVFARDGSAILGLHGGDLYRWPFNVPEWVEAACARTNRGWDPATWARFIPDRPFHVTCAQNVLTQADELALRGQTEAARETFAALVAAEDIRGDASLQTAVCRLGALHELAETVLPACDRAVALAPDDALALESRAIALTLTDATADAADLLREAGRDDWAAALADGEQPFDAVLRRDLRNQFAEASDSLVLGVPPLTASIPHIPLPPTQVAAMLDALEIPFTPLTFTGNQSPLPGWDITRVDEVVYADLGSTRPVIVPGEWGLRYVLWRNGEFIGILQSDGPYPDIQTWVDDMGWFTLVGDNATFEVNGVRVFRNFDRGAFYYFFVHEGVHTTLLYFTEGEPYEAEIEAIIADLTR